MGLNSNTINSQSINGPGSLYSNTYTIDPIQIGQNVASMSAGSVISFEQDVQFRSSISEATSVISIEQNIKSEGTGSVISFAQNVIDPAVVNHYTRTGWDMILIIDGRTIPRNQIVGMTNIRRTENTAAFMDVTLMPPAGIQDIEWYGGKTITLDTRTSAGTYRMYTGIIDIPEVDIIDEKITLRCTDKRSEQLNAQLPSVVSTIGVYSNRIFSEPEDTAQEVEQRLTTTPQAVDFNAYGKYTITPWLPKTVADFTLTDSDVYRERPQVQYASRGRVINKVDIGFQYRYERFYHASRNYSWESPIATDICLMLTYGYSLTTRAMIQAAIDAAGWPLDGEVSYTEIWDSGWYTCGTNKIGWFTKQYQATASEVLDEEGEPVKDSKGDTLLEYKHSNTTDYSKIYCMGATWKATSQWAQTVTEDYTLSIEAPQSITQYGEITRNLNYAIDGESDSSDWENYGSFRSVQSGDNYYVDQDTERGAVNTAIDVALQQAKTTILGSHRDTRVTVDTFLWPAIDLKHTVHVDTDEVEAKGKVYSITHSINHSTTEAKTTVELALFRAEGSGSDDALTIPSKPSDSITFNTQNITLGNHFGHNPALAGAAKWNGMIGNAWIPGTDYMYNTDYQVQFVVDTPPVADSQRLARTLTQSSSYDVEIPNNTLIITFDGKS